MSDEIRVGDYVKLLNLPDWLIHDLPESEQKEMRDYIGKIALIQEIDDYGYFWLGFGVTLENDDSADYSGHSFCIPREFIEMIS